MQHCQFEKLRVALSAIKGGATELSSAGLPVKRLPSSGAISRSAMPGKRTGLAGKAEVTAVLSTLCSGRRRPYDKLARIIAPILCKG